MRIRGDVIRIRAREARKRRVIRRAAEQDTTQNLTRGRDIRIVVVGEIGRTTTSNGFRHNLSMLAEDEGLHVTFSAGLETAHGIAIVVGIVVLGLVITHIDLAGAAINRRRDFNAYSVSPLPDMSEKIFDTTVAGHHNSLRVVPSSPRIW